ncbi:hypothetical protein ABIC45_001406 [Mucilaginibacter rubeus]
MKFIVNISKLLINFRQWMMLKSMRSSFIH